MYFFIEFKIKMTSLFLTRLYRRLYIMRLGFEHIYAQKIQDMSLQVFQISFKADILNMVDFIWVPRIYLFLRI